ncbi:hypothetical protein SAY86_025724 [Trapa natans]|uniref:Patatin n=1 Tax=Trapa natans TaxID=22666 RepID=A0AAN7KCJ9_TRANT|nr:hypothetical protein SAY86_025724 [Trapa natans]
MATCRIQSSEMEEPSIDTDKLSYEIFSILESKFLFGYDDHNNKLCVPKQIGSNKATLLPAIPILQNGNGRPLAAANDISSVKNQRGKICILSIDGGGMRGILSGKALAYLEQSLKNKSGNPDAMIADYFDVAAGTGVGGIFTAMLFATKDRLRPISGAEDTWRFLADQGREFFRGSSSSSSSSNDGLMRRILSGGSSRSGGSAASAMERTMKEVFTEKGRSLTLKDTLKPLLIPCYDLSSSAPFLFSRADALETDSYDFQLWEVCRATTAEPGRVGPLLIQSMDGQTSCLAVDGGSVMSNPAAAAITHVLHNKQEFPFVRGVEDLLVLSIGSGQVLETVFDYKQVKGWKAKDWARPMVQISRDGSSDLVDNAVAMAFGQFRSTNYVRIQANGSSIRHCVPNMDTDASPENVKMLIAMAEEMLKQKNVESVLFGGKRIAEQSNFEKLDWFAAELVQEHRRRSCRIAPTVAFKQAAPAHPDPEGR